MQSQAYPDLEVSAATAHVTVPGSFNSNPSSRFSWQMSKTEKAGNWFTRWFIDWWAMEILSLCFSATCMTIIVVVLWKMDGKEMPRWRLGVSIKVRANGVKLFLDMLTFV
jgi:hypothetical protein